MRARTSWALGAALALSGCYSYVVVPIGSLPPGEDARVLLSNEGIVELREVAQTSDPVLAGTLVRRDDERAFFHVRIATVQEGALYTPVLQEIPVYTRNILQVERRELSRSRTALVAAGSAVAAGVLLGMIIEAYGSAPPPPGESDDARVPPDVGPWRWSVSWR
jgi:hypothetical protein